MEQQQRIPHDLDELDANLGRYITTCLYRVARGHIDGDALDELKQDVLVRILDKQCLDRYDPARGKFTTYLFWITRSVAVNAFEHNARLPRTSKVVAKVIGDLSYLAFAFRARPV